MKTRWMIKVESKIKRGATGRTLLFWSLAPWCLLRTDWSEVWTDSRYDWYFEFILIFWVHSTTTGASLDISLLLINTNQFAHERSNHSTYSITHGSGWVLDSFSNRYIRTQAHEWVLDDFPYRYIRTIPSTWMVDSPELLRWVTSIIWLSNYLSSDQWITVTVLTVALIVWIINFYTHFSTNTNRETETSLPII